MLGRSHQVHETLKRAGATPVTQATDVAEHADVVCVCVFSDDQVREICLKDGLVEAMPENSVLVVHTTGSPRTARTIGVLDAPVSGGPHDITAGRITLLVGGDQAHFDHAKLVLETYGDPILHLGPLGSGQAVKLVNNALFAANIGLVTAAVGLGNQLGIERADAPERPRPRQFLLPGPGRRGRPRLGGGIRDGDRRVPR